MRHPAATTVLLLALGRAAAGASLDEALRLLPDREIHGLLAAASLKGASDELGSLLEAMDRAHLLLGSRPIDQARSVFGVGGGINEAGAWIVAICPRAGAADEGDAGAAEHSLFFIVPVTDERFFFESNFAAGAAPGEFVHGDGSRLWGRSFGAFAVVSGEEPLDAYRPRGDGGRSWLDERLGPRGREIARDGELFFLATDPALLGAAGPPAAGVAPVLAQAGARSCLLVIDFDPLAAIARLHVRFDPLAPRPAAHTSAPFERLPPRDSYAIGAVDLEALRSRGLIDRLGGVERLAPWLPLAGSTRSIDIAAFPSPAGPAGGMLNDAFVIVRTDDPPALKALLKERLESLDGRQGGSERRVTWEPERQLEGVAATVVAYEVRVVERPASAMQLEALAWSLLFGNAGWRGFIAETPTGLVITYSQRPDVLRSGIDAAASAGSSAGTAGRGGTPAAIRTMRQWIAASAPIQAFLWPGRLAALYEGLRRLLPPHLSALRIEPGLPPVGLGVAPTDDGIEVTAVVPAGVLAVLLDAVADRIRNPARADAPAEEPAP